MGPTVGKCQEGETHEVCWLQHCFIHFRAADCASTVLTMRFLLGSLPRLHALLIPGLWVQQSSSMVDG